VGHFRSAAGEQAYLAAYREAMNLLPTPRATLDLETTFGHVRVYEFGAASADGAATPVVLLPGRTSGVPMWASNLPDLAAARITYALDALGDAGLSVLIQPIRDAADQAGWLDQVLAQLPVRSVHPSGTRSAAGSRPTTPPGIPSGCRRSPCLTRCSFSKGCAGRSTSSPWLPRCLSYLEAGAPACSAGSAAVRSTRTDPSPA
jgi:hypothetical protein